MKHFSRTLTAVFLSLALTSPLVADQPGEASTPSDSADASVYAPVRTRAERDALTPQQVLDSFIEGNRRFVAGERRGRNLLQEQRITAEGQHPSAIVLSCIDSRAPAEFIFDKGIGEIFNARIAGNVVNPDIAGSAEFACLAAGAKLLLVVGHSSCGAVNGAIDKVELGNLTALLARVEPAIDTALTTTDGDRSSENADLVTAVTRQNVRSTVDEIRRMSPLLAEQEKSGELLIVGALYDVTTGRVEFLHDQLEEE